MNLFLYWEYTEWICAYTENTWNGSVCILRIRRMHKKSNILRNSKPKSKIFLDVYQEPRWVRLAKSLKTKISHASIPLRHIYKRFSPFLAIFCHVYCSFIVPKKYQREKYIFSNNFSCGIKNAEFYAVLKSIGKVIKNSLKKVKGQKLWRFGNKSGNVLVFLQFFTTLFNGFNLSIKFFAFMLYLIFWGKDLHFLGTLKLNMPKMCIKNRLL
jgi:hypothetical protein